jgi:hypothetical protein
MRKGIKAIKMAQAVLINYRKKATLYSLQGKNVQSFVYTLF